MSFLGFVYNLGGERCDDHDLGIGYVHLHLVNHTADNVVMQVFVRELPDVTGYPLEVVRHHPPRVLRRNHAGQGSVAPHIERGLCDVAAYPVMHLERDRRRGHVPQRDN